MQGVQSGMTNNALRVCVQHDGATRVLSFPADQTVWLGRDETCDVVLCAQEVSRRHVSLFVKHGELFVRDHSTYGTRINDQPVQHSVRSAPSPALLELGPYRVEVTLDQELVYVRLLANAAVWQTRFRAHARVLTLALVACVAFGLAYVRFSRGHGPTTPQVPLAANRPCPAPAGTAGEAEPTVLHAVQLLRAGDRMAALHAYRALAARDDSRAELSIVAALLARELSCQP
jgi:hypothetical protein